jgi:hypothetical protein
MCVGLRVGRCLRRWEGCKGGGCMVVDVFGEAIWCVFPSGEYEDGGAGDV